MNKFISGIVAGKSTLASRATQLSNLVENAVKQNLIKIEGQISNLEMERASLLDFAPNTTDSLRPGNGKDGEFNPEAWAKRLLQIDYDLRELKIQKTLIDAEHKELFTEAVVDETDVPAEIHD